MLSVGQCVHNYNAWIITDTWEEPVKRAQRYIWNERA
jgi:hypothetical protein